MGSIDFLLDFILPKICFGCQRPGSYLCQKCHQTLAFTTIPLCPVCEKPSPHGMTHPACKTSLSVDGMFVLGHYGGVLRKMIHHLKYKNVFSLAETLVYLWLSHYPSLLSDFDFITPVPLHKKRLKDRGYNQAAVLARLLAREKNINYQENILIRTRATSSQMSIVDRQKRRQNLKGAFALNVKNTLIKEKAIGLIDDVATTGATIFEAAKVLKRNGTKRVWGIVLARNIPIQYRCRPDDNF